MVFAPHLFVVADLLHQLLQRHLLPVLVKVPLRRHPRVVDEQVGVCCQARHHTRCVFVQSGRHRYGKGGGNAGASRVVTTQPSGGLRLASPANQGLLPFILKQQSTFLPLLVLPAALLLLPLPLSCPPFQLYLKTGTIATTTATTTINPTAPILTTVSTTTATTAAKTAAALNNHHHRPPPTITTTTNYHYRQHHHYPSPKASPVGLLGRLGGREELADHLPLGGHDDAVLRQDTHACPRVVDRLYRILHLQGEASGKNTAKTRSKELQHVSNAGEHGVEGVDFFVPPCLGLVLIALLRLGSSSSVGGIASYRFSENYSTESSDSPISRSRLERHHCNSLRTDLPRVHIHTNTSNISVLVHHILGFVRRNTHRVGNGIPSRGVGGGATLILNDRTPAGFYERRSYTPADGVVSTCRHARSAALTASPVALRSLARIHRGWTAAVLSKNYGNT